MNINKLTLFICLITHLECTGVGCSMSQSKNLPYPQQSAQQSPDPSFEPFNRMIIQSIQPFIGNDSADKSPAIAVGLVTKKGETAVAMGNRGLFSVLSPDGDTLFGIGSVSKLFVGLILANAVANEELSLTDKANNFLDKDIQIDDRITLRHLVTHYSGLPNFPDNITERDDRFSNKKNASLMPAQDYSRKDLTNCLANNQCSTVQPPGTKYLYSNLGIGLLSLILENRYGFNDFRSLNQAKITNVLNMHKTGTNNPVFLQKNKNNLAQGYLYDSELAHLKPVPFSGMGILAGSGELITSVNDMNKLLVVLTGLSRSTLGNAVNEVERELENTDQPRIKKAYAHRVGQSEDGEKIHFKAGHTAGYSAIIIWRKNPEVGLVVLSNQGNFKKPLLQLSKVLMGRITHQLKQ